VNADESLLTQVLLQLQSITNSYWWTNVYTPGDFRWPGLRTLFA
jgi:hypothetical protein